MIDRKVAEPLHITEDNNATPGCDPALVCEVCRGHPTCEVRLLGFRKKSLRSRRFHGRLCRDCGRSVTRQWTSDALRPRRSFLFQYFIVWEIILLNAILLWRLNRLPNTRRSESAQYWRDGTPLLRRPSATIGIAFAMAWVFVFVVGAILAVNDSGPSSPYSPPIQTLDPYTSPPLPSFNFTSP